MSKNSLLKIIIWVHVEANIIYFFLRLITCNTIEEKIYRRQIFKKEPSYIERISFVLHLYDQWICIQIHIYIYECSRLHYIAINYIIIRIKSVISQNNGENDDPFRHFDNAGIKALFQKPNNPTQSETQKQLEILKVLLSFIY